MVLHGICNAETWYTKGISWKLVDLQDVGASQFTGSVSDAQWRSRCSLSSTGGLRALCCVIRFFQLLRHLFPECVARVPVSLWGSGGWGCIRSTFCVYVRNRPQPFATVLNRSRVAVWPYGRAYGKFCQRDHFWMFASRSCVSRGRHGTSWRSDVFRDVSTVVLCGRGSNTLATFSQDELQFSWRAQHCGCVHRLLRRSVVFFLRIALSGLRQVATRCKFRGRCGIS